MARKLQTRALFLLKDVHSFYSKLLGTNKVADVVIDAYDFKIQSLRKDSDREVLNAKITYDEVFECVNKMGDAAPGSNGLTIGFYKKYFPYFGEYFVDMLNNSQVLPDVFKESITKQKGSKKRQRLEAHLSGQLRVQNIH
jgi:hypothetical protein